MAIIVHNLILKVVHTQFLRKGGKKFTSLIGRIIIWAPCGTTMVEFYCV